MKFDRIKPEIYDKIRDRYEIENNADFENELLSLADEELKNKGILRIKRLGININNWKTLVFVEVEGQNEKETKRELKKAISWIASVKDSLLGVENTDLYLFLAFSDQAIFEECFRIESTEEFCRKYVLLPEEEITEFLNRTFLQKLVNNIDAVNVEDPLESAFSEAATKCNWLTSEVQNKWKKAFLDLSGNELVDALLELEEQE